MKIKGRRENNVWKGLAAGLGAAAAVLGIRWWQSRKKEGMADAWGRHESGPVASEFDAPEIEIPQTGMDPFGALGAPATGAAVDDPRAGIASDVPSIPEAPPLNRKPGETQAAERPGYLPADQPDRNPAEDRDRSPGLGEPTRNPVPGAPVGFPPVTETTRLTDRSDDEGMPGTPGEAASRAELEEEGEGTMEVPVTGSSVEAAAAWGVVAEDEEAFDPALFGNLEGIVTEYLISFHRMIDILRQRRSESGGEYSGVGSSLTPADRVEFQQAAKRLVNHMPDVAQGSFAGGSHESRLYRLAVKIRPALDSLDYSDDDLFRIYGEVRTEACQVMAEGGAGFEQVRSLYECSS